MPDRPSKTEVLATFQLYNYAFFGGSLPEIAIHFRRMKYTDGASYGPCDDYEHGRIVLDVSNDRLSNWRGVLLHELVHAWLDRWDVDEWECGEVSHHGPIFQSECNRIGRLLGLPDVSEEESWAWPDAVFEAATYPALED